VECGALHESHTDAFNRLDQPTRHAVAALLRSARFSMQMQREVLDWVPEIACAEGIDGGQVLACPEVEALVQGRANNKPQALDRIRSTLFARRFPRLAALRSEWEALSARVNPDPALVKLRAPESFERDGIEICIRAKDGAQMMSLLARLHAIPEATWDRLARPAAPADTELDRSSAQA
jgi:hypothetical protein